jgi:iron complex outermembrane recepter protein
LGWNLRNENYFIGANAYWMEYMDELVSTGVVDNWGRPVDGNVPKTRHIGIELQFSAVLIKGSSGILKFGANTTLSRNRIVEFDYKTSNGDKISFKDNPISGFPDFMANFNLSYILEDFYTGLNCKYVGGFRTDNYGDLLNTPAIQSQLASDYNTYTDNKVEPYFVFNADLSYTFRNVLSLQSLKVQAKVNNILNNLYATYGIGKTFFPAAERNFMIGLELGF